MKNIFDYLASSDASPAESSGQSKDELRREREYDQEIKGTASPSPPHTQTSPEIKTVVQELLKYGYLEETHRPDLFRRVIIHLNEVNLRLEPLDLLCRVDSYRGVAFLAVAPNVDHSGSEAQAGAVAQADTEDQGWSHPLIKRQRLTLEQSLLVAILRQMFVIHEQELGVGQAVARVAVDDLLPQFLVYFGDSGSDAKNESRLAVLLDQLKTYGIVSEIDKKNEVTIRPLIAHLANPESLQDLLCVLTRIRENDAGSRGEG